MIRFSREGAELEHLGEITVAEGGIMDQRMTRVRELCLEPVTVI